MRSSVYDGWKSDTNGAKSVCVLVAPQNKSQN